VTTGSAMRERNTDTRIFKVLALTLVSEKVRRAGPGSCLARHAADAFAANWIEPSTHQTEPARPVPLSCP
jgi:hypothetical protein